MTEEERLLRVHGAQLEQAGRVDGLAGATVVLFLGTSAAIGFLGTFIRPPLWPLSVTTLLALFWGAASGGFLVAFIVYIRVLYFRPSVLAVAESANKDDPAFWRWMRDAVRENTHLNKTRVCKQRLAVAVLVASLALSVTGTIIGTLYQPNTADCSVPRVAGRPS